MKVSISSFLCRISCILLLLFQFQVLPALAQSTPYDAVVKDDENNVREFGGENYKQAKILGVLNKADRVRVLEVQGRWARVDGPSGVKGWVNNACLDTSPQVSASQVTPPPPTVQSVPSVQSPNATNSKNNKPIPMASPGHPGYLQSKEGCLIWDPSPIRDETISWNGQCIEGYGHGIGVVKYEISENGKSKFDEQKVLLGRSDSAKAVAKRIFWEKSSRGTNYNCSGPDEPENYNIMLTYECHGKLVFKDNSYYTGTFTSNLYYINEWDIRYIDGDLFSQNGTSKHFSKSEERRQVQAQRRQAESNRPRKPPVIYYSAEKRYTDSFLVKYTCQGCIEYDFFAYYSKDSREPWGDGTSGFQHNEKSLSELVAYVISRNNSYDLTQADALQRLQKK